jgi:hypothetical protein
LALDQAAERLRMALLRAARTDARAAVVELRAAELFAARGDPQLAQLHWWRAQHERQVAEYDRAHAAEWT